MIDWLNLVANATWILGCAMALAAVSYAHWEARARGERLGSVLGRRQMQIVVYLAGVLFCAGAAAASQSVLEVILWLILVAFFASQVWGHWVRWRREAGTVRADKT